MKKSDLIKKINTIIKILASEYPDAKCHLEFKNPFELTVSTILSAQCTDDRVNMTMIPLYKSKYKKPSDILKAGYDEFRNDIKSINFFNNKAKSVIALSEKIEKEYNGKIPSDMDKLVDLPGIGRKSASVILGNCYGAKDVIIVDTHLKRVATRLGLVESDNPEKIESELKEIVPSSEQYHFSMRLGEHGRMVCKARKPSCGECILSELCPSFNKI